MATRTRSAKVRLPPERILKEAALLFSEVGVDGASMRALAERLGVTKAALYYHFPSKEAIHFQIHLEVIDDVLSKLVAIHGTYLPARAKVHGVVNLILESITHHRGEFTVLLREGTLLAPDHWLTIQERRRQFRLLVKEILEEGMRNGEFAILDLDAATLALLGMCNWSYTWLDPKGRLSGTELAYHFSEIFISGISAPDNVKTSDQAS